MLAIIEIQVNSGAGAHHVGARLHECGIARCPHREVGSLSAAESRRCVLGAPERLALAPARLDAITRFGTGPLAAIVNRIKIAQIAVRPDKPRGPKPEDKKQQRKPK